VDARTLTSRLSEDPSPTLREKEMDYGPYSFPKKPEPWPERIRTWAWGFVVVSVLFTIGAIFHLIDVIFNSLF
jgi:hypothetical protein